MIVTFEIDILDPDAEIALGTAFFDGKDVMVICDNKTMVGKVNAYSNWTLDRQREAAVEYFKQSLEANTNKAIEHIRSFGREQKLVF